MHTLLLWVGFHVFVLAALMIDLGVLNKTEHTVKYREAMVRVAAWVALAFLFAAGVWFFLGHERAINFVTGYLIEESLSVDNIFVFVLIFSYFNIAKSHQHRVLFWGILGAIFMRGLMIVAGTALIQRFEWITYLLGGFLIITGLKMAFQKDHSFDPEKNPAVRLVAKILPMTKENVGQRFIVRRNGRWVATPLLFALCVVEIADIVFAVDSIPAIFGVTTDTFIVYTSNIFAILGLRSMYFLLAGAMDKFRYLAPSVAAVLVFVGAKMLAQDVVHVGVILSLGVIVGILAIGITASFLAARREKVRMPG